MHKSIPTLVQCLLSDEGYNLDPGLVVMRHDDYISTNTHR